MSNEFERALEQVKNGEKATAYWCDTREEKHFLALINKSGLKGLPYPITKKEELLQLLAFISRKESIDLNLIDKLLINMIAANEGVTYNNVVDSSVAYSKSNPVNVLPYAMVNYVGGMSYKSENVLVLSDVAETTVNGITYSITNGVITCNGTATAGFNLRFEDVISLPKGNYSIRSYITGETSGIVGHYLYNYPSNEVSQDLNHVDRNYTIEFDLTEEKQYKYGIYFDANATVSSLQLTPTLVKGKTVGGIIHSHVTNINELKIPNEVQALEGYGMGVDSNYYNYIDFENRKYIQKVVKIIITGDEDWYEVTEQAGTNTKLYRVQCGCNNVIPNIGLTSLYSVESKIWSNDVACVGIEKDGHLLLRMNTSLISDVVALKMWLKENNYEMLLVLTTPIETDISMYIDDNYIKAAEGGNIVFENANANAVPSGITYYAQEESVISDKLIIKQASSDIIKDVIYHFISNEKIGLFIVNEAYIVKSFYTEKEGKKYYWVNMWSFFGSYITSNPNNDGMSIDELPTNINDITYGSYNIRSLQAKVNELEAKVNSL